MDQNICRVFTFFSNFLPAVEDNHCWEYCAFGTIDGIDVGENIVKNGQELLDCIWKEHSRFQKTLPGTYNAERIYGVRFGDADIEKEFWKFDPEYPFLFFTRIQCEGNRIAFWNRNNRCKLEKVLSLNGTVKLMTYLTYGNSDLFLVIKAQRYHDGIQVIHTMNQGMNLILDSDSVCYLKNSFSIMAVKHDWIDTMSDSQRMLLNEEKINCVCIKIIKQPNEDGAELEAAIKNKKELANSDVKRIPVLGADDEQIIIRNISWSDFLSLYSKGNGIFCNSNTNYRNIWAGSTTAIYDKLPASIKEFRTQDISFCKDSAANKKKFESIKKESNALKAQYNLQKKILMTKLKEVQRISSDKDFKEINIILNSVPRYAGELFNDYIFFSILPPLNHLLCLLQESLKMGFLNTDDYYAFLKAFCMCVQGSLTSDRHSIQAIDFNSKIYEVPAKLIAFYSAHINFIKKILSTFDTDGEVCSYEFLVAPGINNVVYVSELYRHVSNQKRLIKVEIPEYCLYNLHDMMIILSHETAHYAGRKYRLRDVRYHSVLKNFSHIYVSYVRSWCLKEHICQQVTDPTWELAQHRMETILHRALNRKEDPNYVSTVENKSNDTGFENVIEKNKIYGRHMSQLQENIQMAMFDIVQYSLKNIFGPVLSDQDKPEECLSFIKQASERYMVVHEAGSTLMSAKTTMDTLAMIYEEGFADLMAILILDMDVKEYADCLLNDVKRQNWKLEDCYHSNLLYRVGTVIQCCVNNKNLNLLEATEKMTDADKLIKRALFTFEKNRRETIQPEKYHTDLKNALRDHCVIKEIRRYLMLCRRTFVIDYNEPSDDMNMVRNLFKNYSSIQKGSNESIASAEEQLTELMKIIWNSRDNIFHTSQETTGECHE